jgi:hypothetical protein
MTRNSSWLMACGFCCTRCLANHARGGHDRCKVYASGQMAWRLAIKALPKCWEALLYSGTRSKDEDRCPAAFPHASYTQCWQQQ